MNIHEFKLKTLKQYGFVLDKDNNYCYKGNKLSLETIDSISSVLLDKYIKFFDGKISKEELDIAIKDEKKLTENTNYDGLKNLFNKLR